jgi:hypothetical protein
LGGYEELEEVGGMKTVTLTVSEWQVVCLALQERALVYQRLSEAPYSLSNSTRKGYMTQEKEAGKLCSDVKTQAGLEDVFGWDNT